MPVKFIKNKEDFVCEKCQYFVTGSGYTNHCPECLWSKHVDINPGDRDSSCGGMMEPISLEKTGDEFIIRHKCLLCKHIKPNKTEKNDQIGRFLTGMI